MQHQWQLMQYQSSMAAQILSSSTHCRPQATHIHHKQRVQHSQHKPRHTAAAAAAHAADAASPSSTAIQLSRLQQFQHMLGDIPAQQQQQQQYHGTFNPDNLAGKPSSTKKPRAAGFGKAAGTGNARQQQKQQAAQRVQVKPQDSCPCKSGLQYQACCQPFLSGQFHPRSAPELARARITATLTGDVDYLVSTTHPDSTLALGGSRDLARRTKKQVALFREAKPAVVGMAHCRGDTDGTWLVLAILQATAGEFKGTKAPAMYLMAKRGSNSSSSSSSSMSSQPDSGDSSSSSSSGKSANDWLYMGQTNQAPQHEDADVMWQLLQMHVPELLSGGDDSSSSSSMISREVYFVWAPSALGLPTAPESAAGGAAQTAGSSHGSSSGNSGGSSDGSSDSSSGSSGGWYLDLLQPAVEPLQAHNSSSSRSGGASTGHVIYSHSRAGVISMDAIVEARKQGIKT